MPGNFTGIPAAAAGTVVPALRSRYQVRSSRDAAYLVISSTAAGTAAAGRT